MANPSEQDERIVGETVHARGDDGWQLAGPPLRMTMECQRENAGMNVPVFFDLWWDVQKYDLRLCTIVHIINSDELPMGSQ